MDLDHCNAISFTIGSNPNRHPHSMTPLYQASNAVEAYMILHLLEQKGLSGRVDGEYLQGGIGELPAAGLVRVMVADQDYAAAKAIVDEWDAAQPRQVQVSAPATGGRRLGVFAAGVIAGLICAYGYYRTPVTTDGIDHNFDGVPDEHRTYSPAGRPVKTEADRNLDGKVDYITAYGSNGILESAVSDDDFNGRFESRLTFRAGQLYRRETDTDGDGFHDLRSSYRHGVLQSVEYLHPGSGLPRRIEYFRLGKLHAEERDTDKDGRMDTRILYNAGGEAVASEAMRQD